MVTINDYLLDMPAADQLDFELISIGSSAEPYLKKLKEWRENGLVIFEKVIDKNFIDGLLEDFEKLKRCHKEYVNSTIEIGGKHFKIHNVDKDAFSQFGIKFHHLVFSSLPAAQLSISKEISEFLKLVFQDDVAVMQSLTFERGSEQPLHLDYAYVRTQTIIAHLAASWIPLEDIDEDSGPLVYYPGSHLLGKTGFFDFGNGHITLEKDSVRTAYDLSLFLEDEMRRCKLEPKIVCPKVGDVLIWHGRLVHGGTKIHNKDLTRKSHVTHYTSMSAFPKNHKRRDIKENIDFLYNSGGYVFYPPWVVDKI